VFTLKKVLLPKANRYFFLDMSFSYGETVIKDTFPYNDKAGNYNVTRTYKLDEGKILRKFANESVSFGLHKSKFLVSSRNVSSLSYPLAKLKNYCTVPLTLEFAYKDGKKLTVEAEMSVNKALEKPMKDIYMFVIEKRKPAFNLPKAKKAEESPAAPESAPDEPPVPKANEPPLPKTSVEEKSASKQTKEIPVKPPVAKEPAKSNAEFTSKFKFPLLVGSEKTRLAAAVAKLKLDQTFCQYHLSSFCVTFLEEFEKDVDAQMGEFCENGDTEGRKEAEGLTMKVSQYKNFLEKSLESGKMSQNDYKSKVEAFITLDKQLLVFFEKNGFAQSAFFIRHRLAILETEVKQLQEMGV
jgi:hypothetical protein